ncbi:hypothetical protein ACS04_10845 [Streptomyces roseus]|uniref:Response regulatory domain-containing protein n=1 Tax=Streptomyces roseus TaxID=66430 RepID=A0A0J6XRF8_9ACTN|nr:hypothetical protein ACS04_10845 [Streptomyces roseus]
MTRVLVVEDDPQLVRALKINLQARKFEVAEAPDGRSALRPAVRKPPVRRRADRATAVRSLAVPVI